MSRSIKVLLTDNVDNLGIVGDVVTVRSGYARNYLLPFGLATEPSKESIDALQEKRKDAEKMLAEQRNQREQMIGKLDDLHVTMTRACNDQGILYGSVTQQDIAAALKSLGYPVRPREVRIPHTIKRLDSYDIRVKLDSDLETEIKLTVAPDREMESDEREEMEFDNEGNLIEKPRKRGRRDEGAEAAPEAEATAPASE